MGAFLDDRHEAGRKERMMLDTAARHTRTFWTSVIYGYLWLFVVYGFWYESLLISYDLTNWLSSLTGNWRLNFMNRCNPVNSLSLLENLEILIPINSVGMNPEGSGMITTTGGGFPRFLGVIHVSLRLLEALQHLRQQLDADFSAETILPQEIRCLTEKSSINQSTQRIHPHTVRINKSRKTKDRTWKYTLIKRGETSIETTSFWVFLEVYPSKQELHRWAYFDKVEEDISWWSLASVQDTCLQCISPWSQCIYWEHAPQDASHQQDYHILNDSY